MLGLSLVTSAFVLVGTKQTALYLQANGIRNLAKLEAMINKQNLCELFSMLI